MSDLRVLTEQRRLHVQSCEKNNDNSHETIANLYSDRSHCIYELLQNADDAHATEVTFILTADACELKHNGTKQFSFEDVAAITAVGASPKQNDVNVIGQFGVGFKSVFSVTKNPIIYSKNFNFRIIDFIVPEEIESIGGEGDCTVINLPFNNSNTSKENTHQQILEGLKSLKSESLLFLRHIKIIRWKTKTVEGCYSMGSVDAVIKCVISNINGEESRKEYFLFSKIVKIDGRDLNLSVAYRMDAVDKSIVPCKDASLFVFFPTKEKPTLKFLVHAPYKTTPNRETIPFKGDEQNLRITEELSTLIVESVQLIKDQGLLNVNFLSLLPIDSEITHPLYRSAFEKVKKALTEKSLLPTTKAGNFIVATDALLAREKELADLLDAGDCDNLFGRKTWLDSGITADKTQELWAYLREHLCVPEINMAKFCEELNETFIKEKSDQWLIRFYTRIANTESLYRARSSHGSKGILRGKPIIRLEDDSLVCPEDETGEIQVYLPKDRESQFKTIKKTVASDEGALEFLQKLGVGMPDDVAEIKEFIVPKYHGDIAEVSHGEYMQDFNRAGKIWANSSDESKDKIIKMLCAVNFIGAVNYEKNFCLRKSREVYRKNEILKMWFEGNGEDKIYFLADFLESDKVNQEFLNKLEICLAPRAWGATEYAPPHAERDCHVKGLRGFNPQFEIQGLEFALNNINIGRSIWIFNISLQYFIKLSGVVHECSRRDFLGGGHDQRKNEKSIVGNLLTNKHWLYDKEGCLIKKLLCDISVDDLHDKYETEHENCDNLIKVLGLKLDWIKQYEKASGGKFYSCERVAAFEQWEAEHLHHAEHPIDLWNPEIPPEEAAINVVPINIEDPVPKDLSGQHPKVSEPPGADYEDENKHVNSDSNIPGDSKKIGAWGEEYALHYIKSEHLNLEVEWLNHSGNVGVGYDIVVRENGADIFYYEVKSKTDDKAQFFQMTGAQWRWATDLNKRDMGKMYRILLVSNAGGKHPSIMPINDPVELWKTGRLHAHPVNIRLP